VILAVLVGAVLAFRRERRLLYTEPNGYRPTRSATLLRPTLDLLPRFQRLYAVWHGRGYTTTFIGRELAIGAKQIRARQDAEDEKLWRRHRERWHEDPEYRSTYRDQRRMRQ
jgi:hypothetical protein